MWVDAKKTECGGSHSWEEHKIALQRWGPKKDGGKGGKGDSKGKKGKEGKGGKEGGKGKDKLHEMTEDDFRVFLGALGSSGSNAGQEALWAITECAADRDRRGGPSAAASESAAAKCVLMHCYRAASGTPESESSLDGANTKEGDERNAPLRPDVSREIGGISAHAGAHAVSVGTAGDGRPGIGTPMTPPVRGPASQKAAVAQDMGAATAADV